MRITHWVMGLCILIFGLVQFQSWRAFKDQPLLAAEVGISSTERALLFDFPKLQTLRYEWLMRWHVQSMGQMDAISPEAMQQWKEINRTPTWDGLLSRQHAWDASFYRIRQGEIWRAVTPSILHRDLFHLLFNLVWMRWLGGVLEPVLARRKFIVLLLLLAVASNAVQYLLTGPYFLGLSGVLMGLIGFVGSWQKHAGMGFLIPPPLCRAIWTLTIAMALLSGILSSLSVIGYPLRLNIANAAHLAGGFTGIMLARWKGWNQP